MARCHARRAVFDRSVKMSTSSGTCRRSPPASADALRDVRMLLQIHDELVFEAPTGSADAARELIVDRMQRAMELDVPLVVDSGISGNWYEAK